MTEFWKIKRVKNRRLLRDYHLAHPECEVCGRAAMPTPHHIRSVGLGGSDVEKNIISLCWDHHVGREGWHSLGGHEWYRRFKLHLTLENRKKVEDVLRIA